MRLFRRNKNKKEAETNTDNTIQVVNSLRKKIQMLEKKEKHTEARINKCLADVKELIRTKNKKRALMILKKKSLLEKELSTYSGAMLTLEQQIMTLEASKVNQEVFSTMKTGATELKTIQARVPIEKIDDLMDDIADSMQTQNEVSEALAAGIMGGSLDDDADLLAELEGLEEEHISEEMLREPKLPTNLVEPGVATVLPKLPTAPVSEEEAEMA